ncbi:MAG: PepSY domain-containing protein [Flavobacteriaceae bacterium]
MLRSLHRLPGLAAAILVIVLAASGAALSVFPAMERRQAPPARDVAVTTTAQLASRVKDAFPGVEQIKRSPSGQITAFYFRDDVPHAAVIDPLTGLGIASHTRSPTERWLTNLHRSLFLGDGGRLAAAAGAGAMLLLSFSGLALLARRSGGWRKIFAAARGSAPGRWHVTLARVAAPGFILSSLTALVMFAGTFGILPKGSEPPAIPSMVSGQSGYSPADMPLLQATPLSQLRELSFPYADDKTDVFTLKTDTGDGFIDQGTGQTLAWTPHDVWQRFNETIYMLHTGHGVWWLGLLLGMAALAAPVLAATGFLIWNTGRRSRPRIAHNAAPARADTVILVGSEGGTTWGFAASLHKSLTAAGQHVHVAAMDRFAPHSYRQAERILILTATYGDGDAPASARQFLTRLAELPAPTEMRIAILGFGERQFAAYCAFAHEVARRAARKGWKSLIPMDTVDRQSPQDFARWGRVLGEAMGIDLELVHHPAAPRTHRLALISRRDYGAEMQAPSAILRFALPQSGILARLSGEAIARFEAGDLIGIMPHGSNVPRFYSLASGSDDGFIEICVSRHPGGLCSGQLLALNPGDTISGFIRRNDAFRPARNRKPVIMIGAGTGIGPLAGFARANDSRRPMHLYFGARHPRSDLLYEEELKRWHAEGRLETALAAFSRAGKGAYVQDIILRDAARLRTLIENGAQILVCGSRDMAAGVHAALSEILLPSGLTPVVLKAKGQYAEDVY